jgi:hypothetical protein
MLFWQGKIGGRTHESFRGSLDPRTNKRSWQIDRFKVPPAAWVKIRRDVCQWNWWWTSALEDQRQGWDFLDLKPGNPCGARLCFVVLNVAAAKILSAKRCRDVSIVQIIPNPSNNDGGIVCAIQFPQIYYDLSMLFGNIDPPRKMMTEPPTSARHLGNRCTSGVWFYREPVVIFWGKPCVQQMWVYILLRTIEAQFQNNLGE